MDRWGCIRFPDLPLQVALLRRQNREVPFAVVRDERPSSPLLFVNAAASEAGLSPGMRYTAALSVVPRLHADVVTARELGEVRRAIVGLLSRWSPRIEPCSFDAEVFWIDASGLSALHGAPERWGAALRDHLEELGYRVDLVIGFSRRGSYVLARTWRRSAVVASTPSERRAVAASPVDGLPLPWPLRDLLAKLNVQTVAEFDRFPRGELTRRLGRDALASLDALDDARPLQPAPLPVPTVQERRWDDPLTDLVPLKEILWELLAEELERLRPQARLIESITFELIGEDGMHAEVLQPAQATANAKAWRRLLELRLELLTLTSGVLGVRLDIVSVPPPPPGADLFDEPPRDLKRGEKALSLIRARWGDEAVVQAVAADSHVPEQSYGWKPVLRLSPPRPAVAVETGAVRRVFREPRPYGGQNKPLAGPFVFQGIGTDGQSVLRRYWFVHDGQTQLWLCQEGWAEPRVAGVVD